MRAHCHCSLGQVLLASIFSRPVLLLVFCSRKRQRSSSSRKRRKLNLSFKLYCCLEAFWQSKALLFLWRPEDLMGTPQAYLALRLRGVQVHSLSLWGSEPAQMERQSLEELRSSPAPTLAGSPSLGAPESLPGCPFLEQGGASQKFWHTSPPAGGSQGAHCLGNTAGAATSCHRPVTSHTAEQEQSSVQQPCKERSSVQLSRVSAKAWGRTGLAGSLFTPLRTFCLCRWGRYRKQIPDHGIFLSGRCFAFFPPPS